MSKECLATSRRCEVPRLLAYLPMDAWAFVRDGDRIFRIKPPFDRSESRPVCEDVVANAVANHDYVSINAPEEPWSEVVERVRCEACGKAGSVDPKAFARDVLDHAPPVLLEAIVGLIETEWIHGRSLVDAKEILMRILAHHRLQDDESLLLKVVRAYERVQDEILDRERRLNVVTLPARLRQMRENPLMQQRRSGFGESGRAGLVGVL